MKFKSSFSTRTYLFGTLALLLFVFWIGIIYKSFVMRTEIQTLVQKEEQVLTKEMYTASVKKALRDSKQEIDSIEKRFIDKDSIPQFIDMLEGRIDQSGSNITVGSINFEPGADRSVPGIFRAHITGAGTWREMITFINTLESLPYALSITSLTLSKTSAWTLNADIVQYVSP